MPDPGLESGSVSCISSQHGVAWINSVLWVHFSWPLFQTRPSGFNKMQIPESRRGCTVTAWVRSFLFWALTSEAVFKGLTLILTQMMEIRERIVVVMETLERFCTRYFSCSASLSEMALLNLSTDQPCYPGGKSLIHAPIHPLIIH